MLVSIIIPVFNEVNSVIQVLHRVLETPLPEGVDREIILVDDGSTDGTTDLLQATALDPRVHVHYSMANAGKGTAVRIGMRYAKGEIVTIQDADLEYDPFCLPALIAPLLARRTRVVYGSRFLGQRRGMLALQGLGNRVLTLFTNLLFGSRLTDSYTCYKVMDQAVARFVSKRLVAHGFEIEAEITGEILKHGIGIVEVPISYTARLHSQGKKIRARDGFIGLYWLLKLRFLRPAAPAAALRELGP